MRASTLSIVEGIKTIGVGKRGNRALSAELALAIFDELKTEDIPEVVKGAFWGALVIKGITEEEKILEEIFEAGVFKDSQKLAEAVAPDAPRFVQEICARLLRQETLDQKTSRQLGNFLFSDSAGDAARGMAASILRVRYETAQEYAGLLESLQETIEGLVCEVPEGDQIVQIAEPFDGVDQSYMVTPLLARHVQILGYRVVSLVGRNSGPKFGNNLLDVAEGLQAQFLKRNVDLKCPKPDYGWYIHQKNLSRGMDRWVELRLQIIKRPFLATLERFVNPVRAQMIIASAFHPPYAEKMVTVGEGAGYSRIIIVRNGLEGTLAFPLLRSVKILCSVRGRDGSYRRQELEWNPRQSLGARIEMEEKLTAPALEKNVQLIKEYTAHGRSGHEPFDWRIKATCEGIQQAMGWINEQHVS